LAYFSVLYQRTEHADASFTHLENKVWFENSAECVGKLLDSLFVNYCSAICTEQKLTFYQTILR